MAEQLDRILANEELSAEILRLVEESPEAEVTPQLEAIGGRTASAQLRRLIAAQPELEKIVRETGRPALLVQRGTFEAPETDYWRKPLEAARPLLEQAIRSVGRVELRDHPELDWGGTAWILEDYIAVTNRHVAELFATLRDGQPVFRSNPNCRTIRSAVDFLREHGSSDTLEIFVEDILFLPRDEEGAPDMALLQLAKYPQRLGKIALSSDPPQGGQQVAVIGYPAWDWYDSADLQGKIFGNVYDVKRLAPGEVKPPLDEMVMSHDCSTLGGNSGSVVLDLRSGKAVGLHYAGKSRKANYAVRAQEVADILASVQRRARRAVVSEEETRRKPKTPLVRSANFFAGRKGYDPEFLGPQCKVQLPGPGRWSKDLAKPEGSTDGYLHYTHFSVAMSRSRRMALFAAVNIDGKKLRRLVRRKDEVWSLDGRLPAEVQIGNDLYEDNPFDRGHLVRRLDPVWGDEAEQADEDTFHFTNACPQHKDLNRKTWLALEDYILEGADTHDLRVSVFTGPVLAERDRLYDNKARHDQVRLPSRFWKVAVMVLEPENQLSATGYLLSQRDLIKDLEFGYGAFRTYQVPVAYIEKLTGLDFGKLREHDPLGDVESPAMARPVESSEDIVFRAAGPVAWNVPIEKLKLALKEGGPAAVEEILEEIQRRVAAVGPMPSSSAERALGLLRSHRKFNELVRLSEALRAQEAELPALRRLRAQGLIETGAYEPAIQELCETRDQIQAKLMEVAGVKELTEVEERLRLRLELAEVTGLLGRAYKQRFVDSAPQGNTGARREDARQSLRYYLEAYETAPVQNLWHGINYVAVGHYVQNYLDDFGSLPIEPVEIARKILSTLDYLEDRGMLSVWDYATRAEALLALDRRQEARLAYEKYLGHPEIDLFAKGSTRRQLEQIWQVAADDEIFTLFGATLPVPEIPQMQLEARYKDAPYAHPSQDPLANSRARAVVRLGRSVLEGDGTGFLFDGADVSPKLEGKLLLLTCAHVCPELLKPEQLTVIFFGPGLDPQSKFILEYVELLWYSPSTDLDAALLLLREDGAPYGVKPAPVSPNQVEVDGVAYIIGHPMGGSKFASLSNNHIQSVDHWRFRYTSATDPGSSGSPVFDEDWRLIGIHHAGDHSVQLNEASRLDRILERLRTHPW